MRQEVKFSESVGKTIEAVRYGTFNSQAVVAFTDGTFATIGIALGYERGDEEVCDDQLELLAFGDEQLVESGVISKAELAATHDEHESARLQGKAALERAEYDRLKQIFEPE